MQLYGENVYFSSTYAIFIQAVTQAPPYDYLKFLLYLHAFHIIFYKCLIPDLDVLDVVSCDGL